MEMYVVYENPLDYPGLYVVRKWTVGKDGPVPNEKPLKVHGLLSVVHEAIPKGLAPVLRDPQDDLCIKEIWI